jgi:hypothetical protein
MIRHHHKLLTISLTALTLVVLLAVAAPEAAARDQSSITAQGARTLAEIAGGIQLERGTEGGEIVISDHNLAEIASRGKISEGGGVSFSGEPSAEPEESGLPGSKPKSKEDVWRERYQEQQAKIRAMEKGLNDFDSRVSNQRNPYRLSGPQNQPPGVVSPNVETRDKVSSDIEAERRRLEAMRRRARREGIDATK